MSIYKKAIEKFGIEKQLVKLAEECSELAQASCKQFLYGDNLDNLTEEIIDVEIVIRQIVEHYNLSENLKEYEASKLIILASKIVLDK